MKRALIAAVLLAAAIAPASAAAELPSCLSSETQALFRQAARSTDHLYISEIASDDPSKRWCFIQFIKIVELPTRVSLEAVFTLEWINEASGKYWLQIREQARLRCFMNAKQPHGGLWPAHNLCPGATASGTFIKR